MTEVLVEDGPDKGAVWHFGQPTQEQRALATGEAWADLSQFEIIGITGQDRLSWLHSLTTQHLEKLASGLWTSALILDPQGHIEHQFNLMDDGERTWLTMDAGRGGALLTHLEKMKFMLRVEVQDLSDQYALLRTPGLSDSLGGPFAIVPRGELSLWHEKFNKSALRVGTWALEAERVATGRPRIGFETDYKSIPNELGLLNKSVHMNKGCYCGQETVAKIANLGKPPRRLVMLHLDGSVITIPARGADVEKDGVKVGFIGTVARHHELGTIALAVLKRSTPLEAILTIEGIPATQEATQ